MAEAGGVEGLGGFGVVRDVVVGEQVRVFRVQPGQGLGSVGEVRICAGLAVQQPDGADRGVQVVVAGAAARGRPVPGGLGGQHEFLGVTAYRTALGRPRAEVGRQAEKIAEAGIWVLPNPSGLNAHYRLADLARLFEEMRLALA